MPSQVSVNGVVRLKLYKANVVVGRPQVRPRQSVRHAHRDL